MKKITGLLLACACALVACDLAPTTTAEGVAEAEFERGPNGGRLLTDGDFTLELAIFEAGVPPEFHAWTTSARAPIEPRDVDLNVELRRLGGELDRIDFSPQGEYLRGNATVHEPHSFDVTVVARHAGREHRFEYESYEGRTTIAADVARDAGIGTAVAGAGTISDELVLYGAIAPDATRVRTVHARFPGVIRGVSRNVGDTVRSGDALATIESNESLQTYTVAAPIAGTITARHAEPGDQTGAGALFEIVDLSTVWAELNVFSRDRPRLRTGTAVQIAADNGAQAEGTIDYLAPVGNRLSQSVVARVVLDNTKGIWTPGLQRA